MPNSDNITEAGADFFANAKLVLPGGRTIVPLEPTGEMLDAGRKAVAEQFEFFITADVLRAVYRGMMAARPGADDSLAPGANRPPPPADPEDRYEAARKLVIDTQNGSTSHLQRKLGVGYNEACRLMERMQDEGVVSPSNTLGQRKVLK